MQVILNQDVQKLGKRGAIVNVKDGFARNFLIANGLAVPLTDNNLKKLQEDNLKKTLQLEKIKKESESIKERLESLSLTIPALSQEEDKLYGSVTSQDIAAALKEEGFDVGENSIMLNEPIKALGIYEILIKLHPEVTANIKVWIVKK